jgi:hypothetical protein
MRASAPWVVMVSVLLLVVFLWQPIAEAEVVWQLLAAGAAVALFVWAARSALKRTSGGLSKRLTVHVTPPVPFLPRDPVTLAELVAGMKGIASFPIWARGSAVYVEAGEGQARIEVDDPARIAFGGFRVTASSHLSAVLACDALAMVVGPFTLHLEGVKMDVDGTTPRAALERELWRQQMERVHQLESELSDRKKPSSKKAQPQQTAPRYLN